MDKHTKPAKTIRLEDKDREAIAAIRDYYGVGSDNDAIRVALREMLRNIKQARAQAETHLTTD